MIRAIAVIAALAAAPAFGQTLGQPWDSVCKVSTSHRSGLRTVGGSGVLIGVNETHGLTLCVAHVAIRKGRVVVCEWPGVKSSGTVLAVSPNADIALLIVDRPAGVRPVPVALPTEHTGPFALAGYPGIDRGRLHFQVGEYVGLDGGTLIVASRPISGMSGGAVFDRYGRVVGTVSAHHLTLERGYCGSGEAMLQLCDQYLRRGKP